MTLCLYLGTSACCTYLNVKVVNIFFESIMCLLIGWFLLLKLVDICVVGVVVALFVVVYVPCSDECTHTVRFVYTFCPCFSTSHLVNIMSMYHFLNVLQIIYFTPLMYHRFLFISGNVCIYIFNNVTYQCEKM